MEKRSTIIFSKKKVTRYKIVIKEVYPKLDREKNKIGLKKKRH